MDCMIVSYNGDFEKKRNVCRSNFVPTPAFIQCSSSPLADDKVTALLGYPCPLTFVL